LYNIIMIIQKIKSFFTSFKKNSSTYCILCERYVCEENGICICKDCKEKLKIFPATPLPAKLKYINTVFSVVPYTDSVRRAIRKFKFYDNPGYADALSSLAIEQLEKIEKSFDTSFFSMIDMIIPVPLSKQRLRERGYNQSELIAAQIAKHFDKELNSSALIKHKNNRQQSLTPHNMRQKNVHNVYKADNNIVNSKRILLIDDILTTGSTASECAKTLMEAGAKNVSLFTITNSRKYLYTNEFYIFLKNTYKMPES